MRRLITAALVVASLVGVTACGDSPYVKACMERQANADGSYGDGLDKGSARELCKASEKYDGS